MNLDLDAVARLAWSQLWQLTAVVLIVGFLVHFGCRRRPHLAYALWLVVLVKCLTPPLWSSPTGVFSWAGAPWSWPDPTASTREAPVSPPADSAEPRSTAPSATSAGRAQPESAGGMSRDRSNRGEAEPATPGETAQTVSAPPARSASLGAVLVLAWLGGAVALAGVLLGRKLCYAILLRRTRVATAAAVRWRVKDLSRRLGLRRLVEARVTTQPFGPAIHGLWRPVLVLPETLVGEGHAHDLERILAHELIHVRRGDPLVGMIQILAQVA